MNVRISIIVPIYNMESLLPRCLDSLESQSYENLEIILINDGSSDRSGDICDAYQAKDARIKVIHQENQGVSAARNSGLDIATGDYISFVDPDDWLDPSAYEILSKYTDEGADILRFNAYRKGELLNELPFRGMYEGQRFESEVVLPMVGSEKFGGMFILGVLWIHLYKRSLIERNNIRFNIGLRRCEDRLFTITSMVHASSMLFVDDVLYHYEVSDNSLSNRYDPIRWQQEQLYLKQLKSVYLTEKSDSFTAKADSRIANDRILRVITSINQEYFSINNNTFGQRYKNIKQIINNSEVIEAASKMQHDRLGIKGQLTVWMIKYRLAFLLNVFNTIILLKNKI